tara:strand:+ start:1069 stop:1257 length:189 start_codon:yes stop_codon:yes gene_type:complete
MTWPRTYQLLVRPLKPEWFEGEDLDSLTRIIRQTFQEPIEALGYVQGWIDAGYVIMSLEVEE